MRLPQLLRAWVAEWPTDTGRGSGMVSLCLRFGTGETVPHSDRTEFPRSREDPTPEQHVRFGLLDEQDLPAIRDAIDKYLHQRYMEDMAEHWPPR